jgi:hypothetical protein
MNSLDTSIKQQLHQLLIALLLAIFFGITLSSCEKKRVDFTEMESQSDVAVSASDSIIAELAAGSLSRSISADQNPSEWRDVAKNIPVHKMKPGHAFYFGSADPKLDQIAVTLLTDTTAWISYKHRWAATLNSDHVKEQIEEGEYHIQRRAAGDVQSTNEYWPITDSVLVLFNDMYGFDHGYLHLGKRFCIAKSKSKDSEESGAVRLYPWLDPDSYPTRNGEYGFIGSHELYQIVVTIQ